MAYPAAVSEQFPQSFVIDVQNFSSEISGWIRSLVEKNLFLPDIQCQVQKIVVLSESQRYSFTFCRIFVRTLSCDILILSKSRE